MYFELSPLSSKYFASMSLLIKCHTVGPESAVLIKKMRVKYNSVFAAEFLVFEHQVSILFSFCIFTCLESYLIASKCMSVVGGRRVGIFYFFVHN